MGIKSEDLIHMICKQCGIPRDGERNKQFLSKDELLQVFAYTQKQIMHIDSMKVEIDEHRQRESEVTAMRMALWDNSVNEED
tara:strand:- start:2260 stop:2505 length:246 start_codon:yes stop_codon:yes gene_type:complete